MTFRSVLCKVGFHKWEFETNKEWHGSWCIVTYARCSVPTCVGHKHWMEVGMEPTLADFGNPFKDVSSTEGESDTSPDHPAQERRSDAD
jgi:hypothetical protein